MGGYLERYVEIRLMTWMFGGRMPRPIRTLFRLIGTLAVVQMALWINQALQG